MEMPEFDKLLNCIFSASQCLVESKSLLAIHCLADLCIRLGKDLEVASAVVSSSLPADVTSSLIDRIVLLAQPLRNVSHIEAKIFVEVRTELSCLLQLVRKHPTLGLLVLDKVNFLLGHQIPTASREGILKENCTSISLKIMVVLYKFLVACLDFLNEIDAITSQVFEKIKILIQGICNCKFFTLYIQTVYSLLLHTRRIWGGLLKKDEEINGKPLYDYWIESEVFTLTCAQKMLMEEDYWLAYESGMLAASHGAWFTATFIFGNLMTKVKSRSCCGWLKSLAQLSLCEMKIQLLILPNQESKSIECLKLIKFLPVSPFEDGIGEVGKYVGFHTSAADFAEKLANACSYLNSSWEALKSCITSEGAFCFQEWFLALRVKMLGMVIEIVSVLGGIPSKRDADDQKDIHLSMAECFESLQKLTPLSARLKRLSEEFDLLAVSFIDNDRKSLKLISALALGCALLSFAASFALFVPNLPFREMLTSSQETFSENMLVQNLFIRLSLADDEISVCLSSLLDLGGCPKSCHHHSHSRSKAVGAGSEVKEVLSLCRDIVSRVIHLQNRAKKSHMEELVSQVTENGRELLWDVTMGLMSIPFRTPEYYFRTR